MERSGLDLRGKGNTNKGESSKINKLLFSNFHS